MRTQSYGDQCIERAFTPPMSSGLVTYLCTTNPPAAASASRLDASGTFASPDIVNVPARLLSFPVGARGPSVGGGGGSTSAWMRFTFFGEAFFFFPAPRRPSVVPSLKLYPNHTSGHLLLSLNASSYRFFTRKMPLPWLPLSGLTMCHRGPFYTSECRGGVQRRQRRS
jgi:hypothetical protein